MEKSQVAIEAIKKQLSSQLQYGDEYEEFNMAKCLNAWKVNTLRAKSIELMNFLLEQSELNNIRFSVQSYDQYNLIVSIN